MKIKNKTIMYVSPIYWNGSVLYSRMMPDIVLVDWQLRLLNFLTEEVYMSLIKQHPGTKAKIPKYFFDNFKIKDMTKRFEDVYSKADILLFDYPLSTTFGFAFTTDKPIVFIDFGFHELRNKEKRMLMKRCYVVDGKFLTNNRAEINWDHLKLGLNKCFNLADNSYKEQAL